MTVEAEEMVNDVQGRIYPSVLQCQCHLQPQMPSLACQPARVPLPIVGYT